MRAADLGRIGLGTTLLVRPSLPSTLTATPASARSRLVVRVLAARMLAQGAVGLTGRTWTPAVDAAIETTHALSMLMLLRHRPATARPAALSAAVAATFAVVDARAAARTDRSVPG